MKTLVVSVVDESGSMQRRKGDVIEGYNDFLSDQIKLTSDDANYIFIKFSFKVEVILNNVPLMEASLLNSDTYVPDGGTALYAAIHRGISMATGVHQKFDRIVFLVITDGEENASGPEYSLQTVSNLIKVRESQGNWTFIYVGWDPAKVSQQLNIPIGNAIRWDDRQPGVSFGCMSAAVNQFRQQSSHTQTFGAFKAVNVPTLSTPQPLVPATAQFTAKFGFSNVSNAAPLTSGFSFGPIASSTSPGMTCPFQNARQQNQADSGHPGPSAQLATDLSGQPDTLPTK
jgi:hypothetical protein